MHCPLSICFVISAILVGQAVDALGFFDHSVLRDVEQAIGLVLSLIERPMSPLHWDTVSFWPALVAILWPPIFIFFGRGAVGAVASEIEVCGDVLAKEHLANHPPTPPPGIGKSSG